MGNFKNTFKTFLSSLFFRAIAHAQIALVSFIHSQSLLPDQLVKRYQGVCNRLQLVTCVPGQFLHQVWPARAQATDLPAGLQDGAGQEAGHHQHHALLLQASVHHLLDNHLQVLLDSFKIVNILPKLLVSGVDAVWQQQLSQVTAGGKADGPLEETQHHKPVKDDY